MEFRGFLCGKKKTLMAMRLPLVASATTDIRLQELGIRNVDRRGER